MFVASNQLLEGEGYINVDILGDVENVGEETPDKAGYDEQGQNSFWDS